VRDVVEAFAAMAKLKFIEPVPDVALSMIQLTGLLAVQAQPAAVVIPIIPVVLAAGAVTFDGDTVNAQLPLWVTVTDFPAIVNVALRAVEVVLAATMYPRLAPPLPEAEARATQAAGLVAVHEQPVCAVTVTFPVTPPLGAEMVDGEALKLQAAPSCVTLTATPPTVNVAVRDVVDVLAATVYPRLALPVPEAEARVTQAAELLAVQAQPV
jgi:hypothetical protein